MINKLREAIETGQVLRIRYFGGSHQGVEREIAPIQIVDGNKVRARCYMSGVVKTFSIEKMELVIDGQASTMAFTIPPSDVYSCTTLEELFNAKREDIEALGWVVKLNAGALELCGRFKNGKEKRTPEISMSYEEMTFDLVFDGEQTREANHRKKERPWTLRAKGKTTSTFRTLDSAQVSFWQRAREMAPHNGNEKAG